MNTVQKFENDIANWAFGKIPSSQPPKVAKTALDAGIDTPAVSRLASSSGITSSDNDKLLERVLGALGCTRPDRTTAGRLLAFNLAIQICDGLITPIEGARAIWLISLDCEELEHEFADFGGLVSEVDGVWELEGIVSTKITEMAHKLLQNRK